MRLKSFSNINNLLLIITSHDWSSLITNQLLLVLMNHFTNLF